MKKLILVLTIITVAYVSFSNAPHLTEAELAAPKALSDKTLAQAFENQRSDLPSTGQGTVIKILSDDNQGHRHQRFIIMLESGQTLLIAHNIDLAPRIDGLQKGDVVEFSGEYEWNPKGGVIHWTHRDPAMKHAGGWLKHKGKIYH